MKSTVDELVDYVCTSSQEERGQVRRHVEILDSMDSRFSDVALRLFTEHRHALSLSFVISALRSWLVQDSTFKSSLAIADFRQEEFKTYYNAALIVLEDAISAKSVATMAVPAGYSLSSLIRAASTANFHIMSNKIIARPDLMKASYEELNNYYRPLAVAGVLLDIDNDKQRFSAEASAFLSWISTQPHIDDLLAAALQAKSLDPKTIEAIAEMKKTTPPSLHDGLI